LSPNLVFEIYADEENNCNKNIEKEKVTMPALNGQFGASGGVVSWDTSQEFGSFAPVRALPIPPPAAKLLKRYMPFWDSALGKRDLR